MTTARDLIESALRKIHVLGTGASLDDTEAQDALSTLNAMMATWSAEGDMIYAETIETFNLSGAASYTIGSGATFNTDRPLYISAAYTSSGDTDYPLVQIDNQEYAAITQKDIANIPSVYYYDAGFPNGTLYLYPVPTSVSTITLHSFKPLTSFTSLTTSFSMPPEYESALVYNLALWLAPEYEREASMGVKHIAHESKGAVEAQNKRNENFLSDVDVPDRRRYEGNISSGWWI